MLTDYTHKLYPIQTIFVVYLTSTRRRL